MPATAISKFLELLMLLAFGASWPAQILKTIRVKNPKGKSFIFLSLVMFGYLCGTVSKLIDGTWNKFPVVFGLYILDFLMVGTDTLLSLHYAKINRLKELEAAKK